MSFPLNIKKQEKKQNSIYQSINQTFSISPKTLIETNVNKKMVVNWDKI